MRPIRVYADTSVYGGVFDIEFERPSRMFFEQVREGRFHLVGSALVRDEISGAPPRVRDFFEEFLPWIEMSEVRDDAVALRNDYLKARIVGRSGTTDAQHVAMATVLRCPVIVSWNFGHIVHFEKIPLYNGVNLSRGYPRIAIHTPQEVIRYEKKGL